MQLVTFCAMGKIYGIEAKMQLGVFFTDVFIRSFEMEVCPLLLYLNGKQAFGTLKKIYSTQLHFAATPIRKFSFPIRLTTL